MQDRNVQVPAYKNVVAEVLPSRVGILEINRPEALNALNSETLSEMALVLESWTPRAMRGEIRAILLVGAGEKAFIAGADISEMQGKNIAEGTTFAQKGHHVTKLLEHMPCPTVAAVHGFALGGGTEMAISCDFILAGPKAVFGQPEVGLGIIPGFGATVRLSKFVGVPRAKELIFTGRRIKADEAVKMGLANRLLEAADAAVFRKAAVAVAEEMVAQSPLAIRVAKRLINEFSESTGLNYKLDSEAQEFGALFGSADQREGMSAFVEKRKPTF